MSKIIPVPVQVSVGVQGEGNVGAVKNFSAFNMVASTISRNGSLEINRWYLLEGEGDPVDPNDRLLLNILPRKLLCHICVNTFETEREWLPLVITIDDQRWHFPMRARELENEEVHYQVEIEGEWMTITEAYIGDLIGEEQHVFMERELLPSIDFADVDQIYDHMV